MRASASRGKTVLVSCHILGEVEQVADSVSIIGHGRLLASGPVARPDRRAGRAPRSGSVSPTWRPPSGCCTRRRLTASAATATLLLVEGVPDPAEVTRRLAHHELYVSELVPVRADLESVFLQLTGRREPRGGPHRTTDERGAAMTRADPRRAETASCGAG